MPAESFRELVETLVGHGGFEELRAETIEAWNMAYLRLRKTDPLNPVLVLGDLWFALREQLRVPTRALVEAVAPDDPERALDILTVEASALEWALLSSPGPDMLPCRKAEIMLSLARVIPALRVLHRRLSDLAPAPFEGLAVVRRGTTQVLGAPPSPLIFATIEALRRNMGADLERHAHRFAIRRCTVSLEKGIELGDEVLVTEGPPARGALAAALDEATARMNETEDALEQERLAVRRAEREAEQALEAQRRAQEALLAFDIAASPSP
jgi:hypothetical protein